MEEFLVKARIVKKCVELKHNSGLEEWNLIFLDTIFFHDIVDETSDISIWLNLDLLLVRDSSHAQ